MLKRSPSFKIIRYYSRLFVSGILIFAFFFNSLGPIPNANAEPISSVEGEFHLPAPGILVHLSPEFNPPILKGIKVHPDNPFRFDFILDQGDKYNRHPERSEGSQQERLKQQATKLIKYFLASLTIPEKDLWVNLSPYEKNRIVPESFGQTEMGRDLLAEDYMLKQITASLIYPEDEIGKKFWKRIYEEAAKRFSTTNIPVNTFNKVWIVPEKAVVYENVKAGTAYVVESKLKVMLEQDYLALEKNQMPTSERQPGDMFPAKRGTCPELYYCKFDACMPQRAAGQAGCQANKGQNVKAPQGNNPSRNEDTNALGSQIIREIVIPELTKEVNEDKNFAQLRQVYNSLILATWYKKKIKDSILAQVYEDRNKIKGTEYTQSILNQSKIRGHVPREAGYVSPSRLPSKRPLNVKAPQGNLSNAVPDDTELIYQQYLKAFKKGAYNYIKEETDPVTQETVPRKYFSGGTTFSNEAMRAALQFRTDSAMISQLLPDRSQIVEVNIDQARPNGLLPTNDFTSPRKLKSRYGTAVSLNSMIKRLLDNYGLVTKQFLKGQFFKGDEIFDWLMKNGYFKEGTGEYGHPWPPDSYHKAFLEKTYNSNIGKMVLAILEQNQYRNPSRIKLIERTLGLHISLWGLQTELSLSLAELLDNALDEQKQGQIELRVEEQGPEAVFSVTNKGEIKWEELRSKLMQLARGNQLYMTTNGEIFTNRVGSAFLGQGKRLVSEQDVENLDNENLLWAAGLGREKSTENGEQGGEGMALYHLHKDVYENGGRIEVKSQDGSTTFRIIFDLEQVSSTIPMEDRAMNSNVTPGNLQGQFITHLQYTYLPLSHVNRSKFVRAKILEDDTALDNTIKKEKIFGEIQKYSNRFTPNNGLLNGLRIIYGHLIPNAIDATYEKLDRNGELEQVLGIPVTISLEKDNLIISVQDFGDGIPKFVLEGWSQVEEPGLSTKHDKKLMGRNGEGMSAILGESKKNGVEIQYITSDGTDAWILKQDPQGIRTLLPGTRRKKGTEVRIIVPLKEDPTIQRRINSLEEHMSLTTGNNGNGNHIEEINISDDKVPIPVLFDRLRKLLDEGKIVRINLSGFKNKSPQFLKEWFDDISSIMAHQAKLDKKSAKAGEHILELLKNAFVYGNLFNTQLPIYVKIHDSIVEVFDLNLKSLGQEADIAEMKASKVTLHGSHSGVSQMISDGFSHSLVDIMAGSEVVGNIARIQFEPGNQAMKANTGGIDLTPAKMNLQIKAGMTTEGIKFHLDPAQLAQLQNAPGFVPVIINIHPMTDLKSFLDAR